MPSSAPAPEPDASQPDALQPDARQPDAARDPGLEALSYEQARDELVALVRTLEAGGTGLEESLALWERGEALAERCQRWLDGARERLEAARARSEDGERAG